MSAERAAVDVGLLVLNQGTKPETLSNTPRGVCDRAVIVRVWHEENGKYTLAWDSSLMPFIPCPVTPLPTVVAPQSAITLSREIGNAEILGDSLAGDTYTVTVTADLQSPSLPAQITTAPLFIGLQYIVPPGTVLDGTWAGMADGIQLNLPLHWTADSVTGTGTYQVFSPNTSRCGGGTLSGSGSVTLTASRAEDRVTGHMAFDNGWAPPYLAVLTGDGLLDGHFMSVDVGTCPMPLSLQAP